MNKTKLVLAALTVTALSSGAVFAQGNGNGNGNGNGAIASELKWRNAGHASAQAFLNANPNSAVGKLATLRDATQATTDAYAAAGVDPLDPLRDPALIQADIDAISGEGGSVELVQADIAALDPTSPTYEADLAALAAELAAMEAAAAQLEAELALPTTEAAQAEAEAVVGIDDLSEEALAALWELLAE